MKANILLVFFLLISHFSYAQSLQYLSKSNSDSTTSPLLYHKPFKFKNSEGNTVFIEQIFLGEKQFMHQILKDPNTRKKRNSQLYHKFPFASFFAPSVFNLPADKKSTARGIFTPILDSITYNDFEELNAEILVLGYADKQVISDQDSLYLVLLSQGKDSIQATEAYYKTLSYLRAKEIGDIILSQLNNYNQKFSKYKQVVLNIIIEGRGTESPDPKKTYLPEDDKRRIVKLYWQIN